MMHIWKMVRLFFRSSFLLFLICTINSFGQKQDRIWLFADSAGIDFNDLSNPLALHCNLGSPCFSSYSSIADNQGQLLFYAGGVELTLTAMRVFDKNGDLIENGDSLQGYPWVKQGSMIIPMPGDTNKYYLFCANIHGADGNNIYYNIIDMSLNNHLGKVISKNNLLLTDFVNEKMNAVKHANGRDWWVVLQSNSTDQLFYKFLVTRDSILGPINQYIGSGNNPEKAHGSMVFSKDGSRLAQVGWDASIDIFDFDRCTGVLYNYRQAGEQIFNLENLYQGCSFSPNGNVFYTSSIWYEYKNVYQYDLTATDIKSTKQIIFSYQDTGVYSGIELGLHLLGPDGKIYIAKGDGFVDPNSNTYYTHHIDAIISPDSVGTSCNYQPSYLDLGTGRTIQGLPTMLNYNLGPVIGSICDSLSNGILEPALAQKLFQIYPNPFNDQVSIHSLFAIKGKFYVHDELGRLLFVRQFNSNSTFDLSFLSDGIYFLSIETDKGVFKEKFIKE